MSIVDYVSLEERITARVPLSLRLGLLLFSNYVPRETGVHITTQRCITLIVMLTERKYDYSTNSMRLWTRLLKNCQRNQELPGGSLQSGGDVYKRQV